MWPPLAPDVQDAACPTPFVTGSLSRSPRRSQGGPDAGNRLHFTHASTPPALPVKCPGFRCGAVPREQPVHHVPRSRTVIKRNETLYCSPVSVHNRTPAGKSDAMTMSSSLAMGHGESSQYSRRIPTNGHFAPNDVAHDDPIASTLNGLRPIASPRPRDARRRRRDGIVRHAGAPGARGGRIGTPAAARRWGLSNAPTTRKRTSKASAVPFFEQTAGGGQDGASPPILAIDSAAPKLAH